MSTSYPLRLVGGGLPQTPLEPTREQQGVWLCVKPRDLRERRGERLTITLFWGVWGVYPPERAKGTALCIKAFIFFALFKFYRFSMGILWISYKFSIEHRLAYFG